MWPLDQGGYFLPRKAPSSQQPTPVDGVSAGLPFRREAPGVLVIGCTFPYPSALIMRASRLSRMRGSSAYIVGSHVGAPGAAPSAALVVCQGNRVGAHGLGARRANVPPSLQDDTRNPTSAPQDQTPWHALEWDVGAGGSNSCRGCGRDIIPKDHPRSDTRGSDLQDGMHQIINLYDLIFDEYRGRSPDFPFVQAQLPGMVSRTKCGLPAVNGCVDTAISFVNRACIAKWSNAEAREASCIPVWQPL